MAVHNAVMITLTFAAGTVLGVVFFGGLWLTIRHTLAFKSLGLLLISSFVVRTGIVLAGFNAVSGGNWRRLIACLLGFFVARLVIGRLLSAKKARNPIDRPDASHAS